MVQLEQLEARALHGVGVSREEARYAGCSAVSAFRVAPMR